jgi:hypothetical protein
MTGILATVSQFYRQSSNQCAVSGSIGLGITGPCPPPVVRGFSVTGFDIDPKRDA